MAWRNSELTAEDLKKAGLDPALITELKEKGVTKEELAAMKNDITSSMTELITNQFKEMEGRLTPKKVENNNDNNNNNNNNDVDEATEFMTDPTAFINKKVGQAVGYAAINATKMRMDLALDRAKMTLKGFKNAKLTEEILAEWGQYKPEGLAAVKDFDPDKLLKKVHDMVIGAHADEIAHDTLKREGAYNIVASGSNGGGGNNNITSGDDNKNKKPEDQMTEEDKAMAARYGMTPEQWVKADGGAYEREDEPVAAGSR